MPPTAIALPLYAFLAVEGARTRDFLQGQLTCDLRQATPDRVLSGAWCTVKGRVVASLLLWTQAEDRVLLRLRADLAADTAAALARYAALSRVRIGAAEPAMRCIGLVGEDLRARLPVLLGACPDEGLQACAIEDALLLQRDKAGTLFELWLPAAAEERWRERLREFAPGTEDAWRGALVRHALAEVQAATRDGFLPQMLDYDADGTVSFRKGCYTGQEIIARTHYKGQVKRRLARLQSATGEVPAPGTELRDATRAVGSVVESAPSADGPGEVLAVLAEDALATAPAELTGEGGLRLRVLR